MGLIFKGNFGELDLVVEGEKAVGAYQEGTLEGSFIDDKFEGIWQNKGLEGRVEFTITDGKLKGTWKKGLEAGPMRGKWFGELAGDDTPADSPSDNQSLKEEETLKVHPFFSNIIYSEANLLACAIASLTRHIILVDRKVDDDELAWMHEVINHFDSKGIPVGDVWDEVDEDMKMREMVGIHAKVLEHSAAIIKTNLNDEDKNFLLTAFQNICAADDTISYEEFEALRYTVELWYPGSTEQLKQNFISSGIKLDF